MLSAVVALVFAASATCSIEEAVSQEYLANLEATAEASQRRIEVLQAFEEWSDSQNFREGEPIGSQMNMEQVDQFYRHQTAIKSFMLKSLIESRRQRDLEVIGRLARYAELAASERLEMPEEEETEEYLVFLLLHMMRDEVQVDATFNESGSESCSIESAITSLQLAYLNELDAYPVEEMADRVSELNKKYGTKQLDAQVMSREDASETKVKILPVINHLLLTRQVIRDLERIKLYNQVSLEIQRATINDMVEYGPDIEKLGASWKANAKAGRVSERMDKMGTIWNMVNELLPADLAKSADQAAENVSDQGSN